MRRHVVILPVLLLAFSAGCASSTRARAPEEPRAVAAELLRIHMMLGATPDDEELVTFAATEALQTAQRWGFLRHAVTLRVHSTHQQLEAAAHQRDVPWMRGWARFDEVELEAPSSWGGHRSPESVVELLRHELTHVVMYQRVAQRETWASVDIPLWFREGMASVTSQQGYRRMTTDRLARWLKRNPGADPWMGAEQLDSNAQPVVYGAAHRAFERLLARGGDAGILRILDGIRAGLSFDEAFSESLGTRPAVFLASFRVELEGSSDEALLTSPVLMPMSHDTIGSGTHLLDAVPPHLH
ncbi:MAG: hypothetical protein AB2A00_31785 [Myxococcota bacterium]